MKTQESLVRTFAGQKIEALGVSIFALFWWLSMRETELGPDYALLFSTKGLALFSIWLLAFSSWYLNLHAESTCAFDTCHSVFYAGHAAIQDFLMFFCLISFLVKFALLVLPISATWRILGIIIAVAIFLYKYREMQSVFRWILYQRRQPSNADQCSNINFAYFLCILVRYAAIGYTAYYVIFK